MKNFNKEELKKYNEHLLKISESTGKNFNDNTVNIKDVYKKIIEQQNDFILKLFNDNYIPEDVKRKYAQEYNELKIQVGLILKN